MVIKTTYVISSSELKALIELLGEVCHKSGISEVLTRSLLKKLNENFK